MPLLELFAIAVIVASFAYSDFLTMLHSTNDFTVIIIAFLGLFLFAGL